MKHDNKQVVIPIAELTEIINSVVKDPKVGNSSDLYRSIFNGVKKLNPNDYQRVNSVYKKRYKQDLDSVFSGGLGSTESLNII